MAVVIASGLFLGKFKIKGISLGSTWILFMGIFFGHLGLRINPVMLSFIKDFGLILFVFAIGLQVGPGFFHSFRKDGLPMNLMAVGLVLLARWAMKMDFFKICGLLAGGTTDPALLSFAEQMYGGGKIAVNYATVYPLTMFLGVVAAQVMIMIMLWKI